MLFPSILSSVGWLSMTDFLLVIVWTNGGTSTMGASCVYFVEGKLNAKTICSFGVHLSGGFGSKS